MKPADEPSGLFRTDASPAMTKRLNTRRGWQIDLTHLLWRILAKRIGKKVNGQAIELSA